MEMAKSLFGSRDHEGYVGKEEHAKKLEAAISEDDNELNDMAENLHITNDYIHPKPGGPFSALIPSMWPQDILGKLYTSSDKSVDNNDEEDDDCNKYKYCYDEFGFRIEEEQNEEANKKPKSELDEDEEDRKLLNEPFIEDPQHRLQWIAYLEFSHNNDKNELTWDNIDTLLPHNDKLLNMLIKNGIPHSLRPQLWMRLSGCLKKKLTNSNINYNDVVKETNNNNLIISKQIEKDLLRIMPLNYCFNKINSNGIPRLRRILRSIGWLYPDIGYCQGTGCIVATLLLFLEEEDAFWMMSTIIEDLLPPSYYSSSLLGIQADQLVLQTLINNHLKTIDNLLKNHDIELSLITFNWFLTIFTNCINIKQLLIIWDIFFYNGSIIIFLIILGMLKINEENLLKLNNSADIFNLLSNIPNNLLNIKKLLNIIYNNTNLNTISNHNNSNNYSSHNTNSNNNINNKINYNQLITYNILNTHRHRHLSYLMTDNGILINNKQELLINLPKQYLIKRNLNNKKSYINVLFGGNNTTQLNNEPLSSSSSSSLSLSQVQPSMTTININNDNAKYKNIKKTELLVNLHEIIIKISNHFINIEPKLINKIILIPDYTIDSHNMDHENYINVSRIRKRRAKALHDFERHDDDELGFRKNDIITIISQKDEHCWVGELNGLRGWFPAKFVELLDERSKQYSLAGDDGITETITDLVRGTLAPAMKNILEHGMKRPSFLGGPCHPWLFIEEAATREVEKDFDSVYSRLVLCKTYRLDEDGKVLTPEELLYRCVQSINQSHDQAHAQMDVKFRSLICLGLNEQVLHLWLEVLCSCIDIVQKWYKPSSFIYSPGWVQIKCELRLLSQFSFNLNPDWELPLKKTVDSQPLKDGVRDMLVKHHLFSWDL